MITRFSCLSPANAFTWYPEKRVNVVTGKPGSGKTLLLARIMATVCQSPSFSIEGGTHFSICVDNKENELRYNSELQKWHTCGIENPSILHVSDSGSFTMVANKLYRNEPGSLVPFSIPFYQCPSFLSLLGHQLPKITSTYQALPSVLHRYVCICYYMSIYKPSTLLLDCPELYVHRSRVRYLPQLLVHLSDFFGTQIIAMTGAKLLVAGVNTKNWVITTDPPFLSEAYWRPK